MARLDGVETQEVDGRQVWRTFAEHVHLFRATPSRYWLEHTLTEVLGIDEPVRARVGGPRLRRDVGPPRRTGVPATGAVTTGSASSSSPPPTARSTRSTHTLGSGARLARPGRPDVPARRHRGPGAARLPRQPRPARRPHRRGHDDVGRLPRRPARPARRVRRRRRHGVRSRSPHAQTADLDRAEAEALFERVRKEPVEPVDAERFRAQMLTEMAAMSLDDGLVLQIHAGSWRNHNPASSPATAPTRGPTSRGRWTTSGR